MTSPAIGIGSLVNDQVFEPPVLSDNAKRVLEARYLKKDESGECVETPANLFRRVAQTMADMEANYGATEAECQKWRRAYYYLMASGSFMPNSPTLMNSGREMGMLSACFVLPVRDSITEIFNSIKHTALIQKAGGGTGFAFDELRPTGDYIKSSGGTTSGPISFWKAFSEATNAIQQGAFRRGANMGMMYIHHPDILKFLHAKQNLEQFTNYNISIKITDVWMHEFLKDADSPHVVRNPRSGCSYALPCDLDIWKYDIRDLVEIDCTDHISERDDATYYRSPQLTGLIPEQWRGKVYTKGDIWNFIIQNAWQTGEPGVVFVDRINEHNPTPRLGRIEATNPCGEQPLLPYEACNLGSINLGAFVTDPCTPEASINWEALRQTIQLATRFLDNVIDANNYPLPEIESICRANRKIGLGVMGFADALYKLSLAYDSEEGVAQGVRFMRFINDEAHNYSEHLAKARGCFPNWQGSVWQTKHNRMMRNAAVTTVAPTGTISIIANCSGGIEPMFSLAFIRNVLRDYKQPEKPLIEVNDTFQQVAERGGFLTDDMLERLAHEGTLHDFADVPEDVKRVFVCAHDISPEWHVRMQAAFQQHCDSSISKTINFPNAASPSDVDAIYRQAFESDCKGVTVYRDGCREHQPMALKEKPGQAQEDSAAAHAENVEATPAPIPVAALEPPKKNDKGNGAKPKRLSTPGVKPAAAVSPAPPRIEPRDLPEILSGLRIRQMTPFGNMHVKITVDPRNDCEMEVFAQLGKGGDVATSDLEAICRMISLWLRAGGGLRHVVKQLEGIGSSLQIPTRSGRIMSLGDGLATALKKYLKAKERFGLRSLLLGEVDLAELDNPYRPPHTPERTQPDRVLEDKRPAPEEVEGDLESSLLKTDDSRRNPGARRLDQPSALASDTDNTCLATAGDDADDQNIFVETATATAVVEQDETDTEITAIVELGAETKNGVAVEHAPAVRVDGGNGKTVASFSAMKVKPSYDIAAHYKLKCPECGAALMTQEGCRKCRGCGWSAC